MTLRRLAPLLATALAGLSCNPNIATGPSGKICSDADPCPAPWQCIQGTCQPAGTCGTGTHKCADNSCHADDDPLFCGDACATCPDTRTGHAACVGGQCGSICGSTGAACTGPMAVCLADAGACVGCEVDTDCPTAMPRCDVTRHQCTPCRSDLDCEAVGPPPLPQYCDVPTGLCVQCLADSQCPLGRICTQDTCQPGCNAAHGCPTFPSTTVDCGLDALCHVTSCPTGKSDCNTDFSDGCETDLTLPANCGACARACSVSNTSAVSCVGGVCTSSCASGFGNCTQPTAPTADDGCETSTDTSSANCGGCGRVCASTNVSSPACTGGLCTPTCTSGFASCVQPPFPTADDGCETATNASIVTDCGGCGRACSSAHVTTLACTGGLCNSTCAAGYGNCTEPTTPAADDGCETTFATSVAHCGQCNRPCALANVATATCAGSVCTSTCGAGFANCVQPTAPAQDDGCETNTQNDVNNCGGCGVACSTLNGTPSCVAGQCTWVCAAGFGHCGTGNTGCETNLGTTAAHCGACGRACSGTNVVGASCAGGVCTSTCATGFGNCTQPTAPVADDGCETNLTSDSTHCGSCTRACSSTNVSAAACSGSVCTSSCNAGFGNCLTPAAPTADDGCETNTTLSTNNCGACGRACSTGNNVAVAACNGSVCTSSCNAGFGNCVAPTAPTADDGCETNTNTAAANCGVCGRACVTGGNVVSTSCSNGVCSAACVSGTGDCTQPAAPAADNGCETNLTSDVNHCGSCARGCMDGGTVLTPVCSGSVCTSSCVAGSGNCTQPASPAADNGCETNTNADPLHCGSCGAAACTAPPNATPACNTGVCGVGGCNAGWGDCTTAAGCETNLNTNVDNCGACGRFCSLPGVNGVITRSCTLGLCTPTCSGGLASCVNPAAPAADNGCETNTTNDALNCSACNNVCSIPPNGHVADAGCSASTCGIASCQAGYMNCDGAAVSGCECAGSHCCYAGCASPHDAGVASADGGKLMYDWCANGAGAQSNTVSACEASYGMGACTYVYQGANTDNICPGHVWAAYACPTAPLPAGCATPLTVLCWADDFAIWRRTYQLSAGVCVLQGGTCAGGWD